MAELEHDIRSWTDRAVAGVDPVTPDEAMTMPIRPRGPKRRRTAAILCSAVAAVVLVAAVIALQGGDDMTTVSSEGGGSTTSAPSSSLGVTTTVTGSTEVTTTTTAPEPPSTTTPPPGDAPDVTGTYEGISTYELWTENCTVDSVVNLELTLDTGETWKFHNPNCGEISEDKIFTGNGTFVMTVSEGVTLTGTEHTRVPLADNGGPIYLTITGGTGPYAGAVGSCTLHNHLVQPYIGKQDHSGTFTCDITVPDPDVPVTTTTIVEP